MTIPHDKILENINSYQMYLTFLTFFITGRGILRISINTYVKKKANLVVQSLSKEVTAISLSMSLSILLSLVSKLVDSLIYNLIPKDHSKHGVLFVTEHFFNFRKSDNKIL
jgi:hypothetical protein